MSLQICSKVRSQQVANSGQYEFHGGPLPLLSYGFTKRNVLNCRDIFLFKRQLVPSCPRPLGAFGTRHFSPRDSDIDDTIQITRRIRPEVPGDRDCEVGLRCEGQHSLSHQ